MISVAATVNGESGTIISIKVEGININVIYVDGLGNVKNFKLMYQPGVIIATGAVIA